MHDMHLSNKIESKALTLEIIIRSVSMLAIVVNKEVAKTKTSFLAV